jgi:hypothetical protein
MKLDGYDYPIFDLPEPEPPSWLTGWTPPKHRLRYRLWCWADRRLETLVARVEALRWVATSRARDSGPKPIYDMSKFPRTMTFGVYTHDERGD